MSRTLAIALALIVGLLATSARAEPVRDWVVVYWMCYDNDLEGAGRPILDMLGQGVRGDRVAVVVFADFRGSGGMTRFVLTGQGEASESLPGEGSAVPGELASALAWVAQEMPARRYGVVFLNHGGRLGDSCYDGTPGEPGADWMWVPAMADVLEAWRAGLDGDMELLFLHHRVSNRAGSGPKGWSGLSVMVAGSKTLARYRDYAIYADTLLDEWLLRDQSGEPAR